MSNWAIAGMWVSVVICVAGMFYSIAAMTKSKERDLWHIDFTENEDE